MQLLISLDKKEGKRSYSEVSQVNKGKFAFARIEGDTVYPLHDKIKCRDFLNDTLVWCEENRTGNIYGYTFHGDYDQDNTTLHLTKHDVFAKQVHLLNEIEAELGIEPTKIIEVVDGSHVSVGDKFWQLTTLHSSWYTQAIRELNYKKESRDKIDEHLVADLGAKFWKIPFALKQLVLSIKRNSPTPDDYTMHDNNGYHTCFANKYIRPTTTYGKQLETIAPELFQG